MLNFNLPNSLVKHLISFQVLHTKLTAVIKWYNTMLLCPTIKPDIKGSKWIRTSQLCLNLPLLPTVQVLEIWRPDLASETGASLKITRGTKSKKGRLSVTFGHALFSLFSTHDNLAILALVWLQMVQLLTLYVNLKWPHKLKHQF
jgi:hypothetical protein